jgi:hypothetical protein
MAVPGRAQLAHRRRPGLTGGTVLDLSRAVAPSGYANDFPVPRPASPTTRPPRSSRTTGHVLLTDRQASRRTTAAVPTAVTDTPGRRNSRADRGARGPLSSRPVPAPTLRRPAWVPHNRAALRRVAEALRDLPSLPPPPRAGHAPRAPPSLGPPLERSGTSPGTPLANLIERAPRPRTRYSSDQ